MLHPYQEAFRLQIPIPDEAVEAIPGQELLSLLFEVNRWLGSSPSVYRSSQGKTVYLLYRNVAFPVDDFWDSFGMTVAIISQTWPLCAFGTAKNQETVQLSAQLKDHFLEFVQHSISGKSTDTLETLCFQLDCTEVETAEKLSCLLETMDWQTEIAAMSWKDVDFLREQDLVLLAPSARGMFCYAGIHSEQTVGEYLLSLSFSQKIFLWKAFLKEKLEPVEFEWLQNMISEDAIVNRMEWELSLREALSQLRFRVINQEKTFELFNAEGKRLYFGVDDQSAAQWVLLKILFPLNYP